MGGLVPLGYDAAGRALAVNHDEAASVRTLFDLYLEPPMPTRRPGLEAPDLC